MKERQAISKKLRFEVFKRDKFTCQYCGKSAPQVVLHLDHIQPVSKDGDNDILNLVTACEECNAGKGACLLSDDAAIEKRKLQLDELQERREQIEMMLDWQRGLVGLQTETVKQVAGLWAELVPSYVLNDTGLGHLRKWLTRFGLESIIVGMRTSVEQYLRYDADQPTKESAEKAFDYVVRICAAQQRAADKPYMQQLYIVRGILRNRFSYCNEWLAMKLLIRGYEVGMDTDGLTEVARQTRSWTQWREDMEYFIKGAEDDDGP